MMRALLIFAALAASACRQPTPAETTRNMALSVRWAQVNCKAYQALQTLPRDALLDAKCPALAQGAP